MNSHRRWRGAAIAIAAGTTAALALTACGVGADPHSPASSQNTSVSTRAEGQDRSAQSDLLAAFNTAVTYYYDRSSYDGFTRKIAMGYEPGLLWVSGRPAAPGMMSIDTAEGSSVNISTMSVSGQVFCIAGDGTTAVRGRTDGFTNDCSGGW